MIEKPRPDLLTLSTTFYDLAVSFNLFSKPENRQIGDSGNRGVKAFEKRVHKTATSYNVVFSVKISGFFFLGKSQV